MDFLAIHAQAKPDALAQVEGDRRLTWRELLERRNRLANSLVKQGVGRGEHVIIYGAQLARVPPGFRRDPRRQRRADPDESPPGGRRGALHPRALRRRGGVRRWTVSGDGGRGPEPRPAGYVSGSLWVPSAGRGRRVSTSYWTAAAPSRRRSIQRKASAAS